VHAVAVPQLPLESHVWIDVFEHWVLVGAHTPWQAPPTQALFEHATVVPQLPLAPQVCTPLLAGSQRVVFGAHDPTHVPLEHA
jgi:hypothetical protein